ncbi:hypothetical protein [Leptospira interrogans]|uniref:hypothetical protein n=1 Tax=Leptospira interrogans TaxID=173 RepID=UPI00046C8AEB|nr:hypothetical protein [Leptospira interrogans]UMQ60344.1 hypothetical protein FH585_15860 [Leptospira interrogans]UMQ60346.1 hypothetical protein FH585_15960 [Leptospira interrogans]UNE65230.1 hypothetical protein FH588_01660 [Leptospira interrogans]UNE65232.1 hypothetical protein FH588_01760 [Leptospira interrogans]UNE69054.1 hypothetical protein FH588_02450 [Leptospira interrogans]
MGKEITILAFSLMICLCSCEKGTEAVKKELTGSKKITLSEYQKLNRKQRIEIFNQLEMSNRFELLKGLVSGQSFPFCENGEGKLEIDGKLYIYLPPDSSLPDGGRFLNRWEIDSTGLTIYNTNKLEKLNDYLGKVKRKFTIVYWNETRKELYFDEEISDSSEDEYPCTFHLTLH